MTQTTITPTQVPGQIDIQTYGIDTGGTIYVSFPASIAGFSRISPPRWCVKHAPVAKPSSSTMAGSTAMAGQTRLR